MGFSQVTHLMSWEAIWLQILFSCELWSFGCVSLSPLLVSDTHAYFFDFLTAFFDWYELETPKLEQILLMTQLK